MVSAADATQEVCVAAAFASSRAISVSWWRNINANVCLSTDLGAHAAVGGALKARLSFRAFRTASRDLNILN